MDLAVKIELVLVRILFKITKICLARVIKLLILAISLRSGIVSSFFVAFLY